MRTLSLLHRSEISRRFFQEFMDGCIKHWENRNIWVYPAGYNCRLPNMRSEIKSQERIIFFFPFMKFVFKTNRGYHFACLSVLVVWERYIITPGLAGITSFCSWFYSKKLGCKLGSVFHISVSDVNRWGSGAIGKCGKVKISLSRPRGGKILLNYIVSGKRIKRWGRDRVEL